MNLFEAKHILQSVGYNVNKNGIDAMLSLLENIRAGHCAAKRFMNEATEDEYFENPFDYNNKKEHADDNLTPEEAKAHDVAKKILDKIISNKRHHNKMTRQARDNDLAKLLPIKELVTKDSYYNENMFNAMVDFLKSDLPCESFDVKTVRGSLAPKRITNLNTTDLNNVITKTAAQIASYKQRGTGNIENIKTRIEFIKNHPDVTTTQKNRIEALEKDFYTAMESSSFTGQKQSGRNSKWLITTPPNVNLRIFQKMAEMVNVSLEISSRDEKDATTFIATGTEANVQKICNGVIKCSYKKFETPKQKTETIFVITDLNPDTLENVKMFAGLIPTAKIYDNETIVVGGLKETEKFKNMLDSENIEYEYE